MNLPAIPPQGAAISNTELFRRLAGRMGFDEPHFRESDEEMIRRALDSDHQSLQGITFERLCRDGWASLNLPSPFLPFAEGGFPTASGKCEFFSAPLAAQGMDPLPGYEPARESPAGDPKLAGRYPLVLITAKSALHFLNSSYANVSRGLRAERAPLVEMHPEDATARGIADGDWVRVWNDRGIVELRVRVGDRVRPRVVSMPSGWWASLSPGGSSANTLTSDDLTTTVAAEVSTTPSWRWRAPTGRRAPADGWVPLRRSAGAVPPRAFREVRTGRGITSASSSRRLTRRPRR